MEKCFQERWKTCCSKKLYKKPGLKLFFWALTIHYLDLCLNNNCKGMHEQSLCECSMTASWLAPKCGILLRNFKKFLGTAPFHVLWHSMESWNVWGLAECGIFSICFVNKCHACILLKPIFLIVLHMNSSFLIPEAHAVE